MPIENGFILAAGMGTRMGAIGERLPKVLWPLFDTTLLGLQIHFLRQQQVKKIAVNCHHQRAQIESYLKECFSDVTALFEPVLLDSGGGVHNYLSHHGYHGQHWLLNSDQFIALEARIPALMQEKLLHASAVLLGMPNPGGYGSLLTADDKMIGLDASNTGLMFTGLSAIDAAKIVPVENKSRYFETVANFRDGSVAVVSQPFSFIDFGTVEKYWKGSFELFSRLQQDEKLKDQWCRAGLIKNENLKKGSYACDQIEVLNFSSRPLRHRWPKGSIVLKESNQAPKQRSSCLVYDDLVVEMT